MTGVDRETGKKTAVGCANVVTMTAVGTMRRGKPSGERGGGMGSLLIGGGLALAMIIGCSAAPSSFHPVDPLAPADFSHRAFDGILRSSVINGSVNYPAIQKDRRFIEYLAQLDRVDPSVLPVEERLAFWINAYNAFAIDGILRGETPRPYVGWYRYFKLREYGVGGVRLNLYDLEHAVLRRHFNEPRVHFAIVCASRSCPKLQSGAYDGGMIQRQLDQAAREFINDPVRNRFDRAGKVARLSRIFDWFEEDFVAAAGGVLPYVGRYVADPELARELASVPYRIEYLDYDWSLNGIPPEEVSRAGAP